MLNSGAVFFYFVYAISEGRSATRNKMHNTITIQSQFNTTQQNTKTQKKTKTQHTNDAPARSCTTTRDLWFPAATSETCVFTDFEVAIACAAAARRGSGVTQRPRAAAVSTPARPHHRPVVGQLAAAGHRLCGVCRWILQAPADSRRPRRPTVRDNTSFFVFLVFGFVLFNRWLLSQRNSASPPGAKLGKCAECGVALTYIETGAVFCFCFVFSFFFV